MNESENITGLASSTSYDIWLVITRGTANDTSLTSSTTSFTTLAGEPLVTTDAASSVTNNTAVLNATLDINEVTTVTGYWKWGTDNPPTQNTTTPQSLVAHGAFSDNISGLSANTTYYAQAYTEFATPTGSPNNGSIVSFTTPVDPAAEAAQEDHVQVAARRRDAASSTAVCSHCLDYRRPSAHVRIEHQIAGRGKSLNDRPRENWGKPSGTLVVLVRKTDHRRRIASSSTDRPERRL